MRRITFLATTTAALLALTLSPALAGPSESAFLQKLSANWVGHGRLSGADGGPVACRIVISGGGQSAKYQGRCTIPDMAAQAFNGAISYNDATKQYESRSIAGTAIGIRRGNALVFTTKDNSIAGRTYSTMTLSPNSLTIDFSIIDQNGQKTTSHISFSK